MEQEKKLEDAAKYYAATHLQVQAISQKMDYAAECRPHVCETCNKGFTSKYDLVKHVRIHTGEKPFHCSYCTRCFTESSHLHKHEKAHRGERNHKCLFCPKAYVTPGNLNEHLRTHFGLQLYQCPDCPKRFYSATNRNRHRIRKHGLERPYSCVKYDCDDKFIDRSELNRHLKSVHGILLPYECSKCDQRFRIKRELLCHEGTHKDGDKVIEKQSTSTQPKSSKQKSVIKSGPVAENQNSMEKSSKISGNDLDSNTKISKDAVSSKKVQDRFLNEKRNVVKVSPKNQVIFSKSKNTEKTSKKDQEEIVVIYQGNEKEEATKECSANNKFEKLSPKTQIGKNRQITEKLQKPDEEEIVVIYQVNQKEEVPKESSVNGGRQTKKRKIVSQGAENEITQRKDYQSYENFQNSETIKKKNEKQKIIDLKNQSNQMQVDKTKGSIKLKRQKKTKKCEFTFRERIDGLQNKYEEQIVVVYEGTPQKETVKECSANNKIDNKKRSEKRMGSENIENEAPGTTEIQIIDISSKSSDHSKPKKKKKKNTKEEIIDVENQNIITIEDDENENEQSVKKIKKYECSCGKHFSSTSIFKRHRKRRGHHRPRIHVCPFCEDESFKTIRRFELHFNEMHCDNSEEEEEEEEEVEEDSVYDSDEDGPLIHECFLCLPKFRAFPDIEALERHYNRIHKSSSG